MPRRIPTPILVRVHVRIAFGLAAGLTGTTAHAEPPSPWHRVRRTAHELHPSYLRDLRDGQHPRRRQHSSQQNSPRGSGRDLGAQKEDNESATTMFGCDRAFHAPTMLATTEGEIWIQRACVDDSFRHATKAGFQTLGGPALSVKDVAPWVQRVSAETGVPPSVLHALIGFLSGYHPYAVSRDGRQGLLQLSPDEMVEEGFGDRDLMDPQHNIECGARYLKRLISTYEDVPLALGAFVAGRVAVLKSDGIPDDQRTRWIVREVVRKLDADKAPFPAHEGAQDMARVWSWLN